MTQDGKDPGQDRLVLRSRLSDMVELPVWIAVLGTRHSISDDAQFAMNLCLEEAVSNVIRHGYAGVDDGAVLIDFRKTGQDHFEFVVEDQAPHFNPLDTPEKPAQDTLDETRIGGRGIRLLRHFASALAYEPLPTGNRLRISF